MAKISTTEINDKGNYPDTSVRFPSTSHKMIDLHTDTDLHGKLVKTQRTKTSGHLCIVSLIISLPPT